MHRHIFISTSGSLRLYGRCLYPAAKASSAATPEGLRGPESIISFILLTGTDVRSEVWFLTTLCTILIILISYVLNAVIYSIILKEKILYDAV